jgi:hypothetical protein
MVPYPGTPICDNALTLGLISASHLDEMADSTHGEPIMPTQFLTISQLKSLFREFHLEFLDGEFFAAAPAAVAAEARLVLRSANVFYASALGNETP